jgi:hypothetical protein
MRRTKYFRRSIPILSPGFERDPRTDQSLHKLGKSIAMKFMQKVAVTTLLAMPLSGCLQDQEIQISKCRIIARRAAPEELGDTILIRKHAEYMNACMRAAGYESDISPEYCQPGNPPLGHNPYCYSPAAKIAYVILKIEIAVRYLTTETKKTLSALR